jgi:hypothetical protein
LICYDGAVSDQPAQPSDGEKPLIQPIEHQPVAARVPERVARGVYSTGQLVLDGPKEFVIDFLQGLTRPHQIGMRVVVTPQTLLEMVMALRENLGNYTRTFGAPPPFNPPPQPNRPTIQEIYEHFRLSDDQLSGQYANSVLIGHSQTEFFFDFITTFYPTPAVSARVLMSAAHVSRFLSTLETCLQQYQTRFGTKEEPPSPPPPPPPT